MNFTRNTIITFFLYLEAEKKFQNSKADPKTSFPRFIAFPVKYDHLYFSLLFFEPTMYSYSNENKL